MEQEIIKNEELNVEEVNVYDGCGDYRLHCTVDCLFGNAWITPEE